MEPMFKGSSLEMSDIRLLSSGRRGAEQTVHLSWLTGLPPHGPLALQNRLQRAPRLFRQMVRLAIRRIPARNHVCTERLHGVGDQRRSIAVPPHELGRRAEGQVQDVVENEDLSVAVGSSAD